MNRTARIAAWAIGALAGGTLLIGLAHLPVARSLLAYLPGALGCPVSLEGADPVATEAFRRDAVSKKMGQGNPASLSASVFTLSQSREDVQKILASRRSSCEETRQGSVIRCAEVSLSETDMAKEVHLQFDAQDRLVAVDFYRPAGCAEEVMGSLEAATQELEHSVGPRTVTQGVASAEFLVEKPYRRVAHEFRYAGYVAKIVALRAGDGLRVRQSYQWVPQA